MLQPYFQWSWSVPVSGTKGPETANINTPANDVTSEQNCIVTGINSKFSDKRIEAKEKIQQFVTFTQVVKRILHSRCNSHGKGSTGKISLRSRSGVLNLFKN